MDGQDEKLDRAKYEEVLELYVFPITMYELQRKNSVGVWQATGLIRGRIPVYKAKAEEEEKNPGIMYRVLRQDQADAYREGILVARRLFKHWRKRCIAMWMGRRRYLERNKKGDLSS